MHGVPHLRRDGGRLERTPTPDANPRGASGSARRGVPDLTRVGRRAVSVLCACKVHAADGAPRRLAVTDMAGKDIIKALFMQHIDGLGELVTEWCTTAAS